MKTEIKIPVRAYAVKLKDERTGEKKNDVIVIEKARLQAAAMVGLRDDEIVYRAYNRQGYRVLEIAPPEKLEITVDLHSLYYEQAPTGEEWREDAPPTRMEILQQFGRERLEDNSSD